MSDPVVFLLGLVFGYGLVMVIESVLGSRREQRRLIDSVDDALERGRLRGRRQTRDRHEVN